MRILITGGGGMIGQSITRKHLEKGDEVFIYDTELNKFNDYSHLEGRNVTWADSHNKLRRDIAEALNLVKPDVISHQAALVGVGQSQYDIYRYFNENVNFTAKLLKNILDLRLTNSMLILAGSMGPYDSVDDPEQAVGENYPRKPKSMYSLTKQTQEDMFRIFSDAYGVTAVSLRYFSVYSTTQNPLNPYTGVISLFANQCLNSDAIRIFEDGNQTRDLINADDVAEAHFLTTRKLNNTGVFVPINIGTGKSYTVKQIAERVRDNLDPEKEIICTGENRKGDIRYMKADISRAKVLLEWYPKHNLFEDIDNYCAFILKNKEKFRVKDYVSEEHARLKALNLVR